MVDVVDLSDRIIESSSWRDEGDFLKRFVQTQMFVSLVEERLL